MAIQCKQCNQTNRVIAKYCKYCGAEVIGANLQAQSVDLDELVGLTELKNKINK